MPHMVGQQRFHPADEQCKYNWISSQHFILIVINTNFPSFKVIVEIMRIFHHIYNYQIKKDLLKRFMSISYAFIERLNESNTACAVEMSCLDSLFKIRADIIRSENQQQQMDELSTNCCSLMSQVSSHTKNSVYYSYQFLTSFFVFFIYIHIYSWPMDVKFNRT